MHHPCQANAEIKRKINYEILTDCASTDINQIISVVLILNAIIHALHDVPTTIAKRIRSSSVFLRTDAEDNYIIVAHSFTTMGASKGEVPLCIYEKFLTYQCHHYPT